MKKEMHSVKAKNGLNKQKRDISNAKNPTGRCEFGFFRLKNQVLASLKKFSLKLNLASNLTVQGLQQVFFIKRADGNNRLIV